MVAADAVVFLCLFNCISPSEVPSFAPSTSINLLQASDLLSDADLTSNASTTAQDVSKLQLPAVLLLRRQWQHLAGWLFLRRHEHLHESRAVYLPHQRAALYPATVAWDERISIDWALVSPRQKIRLNEVYFRSKFFNQCRIENDSGCYNDLSSFILASMPISGGLTERIISDPFYKVLPWHWLCSSFFVSASGANALSLNLSQPAHLFSFWPAQLLLQEA